MSAAGPDNDTHATLDAARPGVVAPEASAPDVSVTDASTLPPLDVATGDLPVPAGPPFGWSPLRITSRRDDGGSLVPTAQSVLTYDASRRIETTTDAAWTDGAWLPTRRTTTTYDAAGRIVEQRGAAYAAPTWSLLDRWTYDYDAMGLRQIDHHEVMSTRMTWVENHRRPLPTVASTSAPHPMSRTAAR